MTIEQKEAELSHIKDNISILSKELWTMVRYTCFVLKLLVQHIAKRAYLSLKISFYKLMWQTWLILNKPKTYAYATGLLLATNLATVGLVVALAQEVESSPKLASRACMQVATLEDKF